MKPKTRSINQLIEEQVQKWQIMRKTPPLKAELPVITVSREPGSGGKLVAARVAEKLGLDLFHQEVIHEMAQSAQVETRLLKTLDEKGLSVLEDWDILADSGPASLAGRISPASPESRRHHRQARSGGNRGQRCEFHSAAGQKTSRSGDRPPERQDRKCGQRIRRQSGNGPEAHHSNRIRSPGIHSQILSCQHCRSVEL